MEVRESKKVKEKPTTDEVENTLELVRLKYESILINREKNKKLKKLSPKEKSIAEAKRIQAIENSARYRPMKEKLAIARANR